MRTLVALLTLLGLLVASPAMAQSDGTAVSPYRAASIASPLAALKVRLGAPVLTFGPSAVIGDTPPNFICPTPGSSPCYVFGSNQAPWETTATSPTTGYSGTGAGSSAPSVSSAPATVGYGAVSGGTTTQVIGHNFNPTPANTATATFPTTWSQPFPDNALPALSPGTADDSCGAWPTSSFKIGGIWYLFVHNEGPCDYVNALGDGQIAYTNESSSLWQSTTAAPGSWTPVTGAGSPGTIISSLEPLVPGWLTGVGDATMIPGDDGFMYVYASFFCQYTVCDYQNAVARAPMNALAPGNWKFLYNGCFCAPALNNPWDSVRHVPQADLIPFVGSSITTMPGTPFKALSTDGKGHAYWRHYPGGANIGGIALSISLDYKTFYTFPAPLVNYDFQNFGGRPTPDDLYLYATFRDDVTGSSVMDPKHSALWAIYVPPNTSLSNRYYIQWPVSMGKLSTSEQLAGVPQFGVTLQTWLNGSTGQVYSGHRRTTTANPFAGVTADGATEVGWAKESFLGYLMTNCPGSVSDIQQCDAIGAQTANRIEECWSGATADDYQLKIDTNGTAGSCPGGWQHQRTVGWLYKTPQPFGTNSIYACSVGSSYHFASNDSGCNGQTVIGLLGYALAN